MKHKLRLLQVFINEAVNTFCYILMYFSVNVSYKIIEYQTLEILMPNLKRLFLVVMRPLKNHIKYLIIIKI